MPIKLTEEKLISALIQLRKEAGMTQDQVAQALRKPQSFVSKYESGERSLDFIEVIDIFEALELDAVTEISKLISR